MAEMPHGANECGLLFAPARSRKEPIRAAIAATVLPTRAAEARRAAAAAPRARQRASWIGCRGDPVGRPAGPWWAGTRDDAVARRQDRPPPGAARRPLPGRERRLFVASLGTARSFLSAHSTDQTLPAGTVGATRWVAHWVRSTYGRRVGSHAAGVHDGGRATYRVAPTYSRCDAPANIAARPGAVPEPRRERRVRVQACINGFRRRLYAGAGR